jgi:hypothetical protein
MADHFWFNGSELGVGKTYIDGSAQARIDEK